MWLFAVYLWVCIFEIADEYLGLSESVRVCEQVEGLSWPVDYPSLNERRLQRGEVDGVNAWMMDWRIGWVERCRVGAYTWEGRLIERKFEKKKQKNKNPNSVMWLNQILSPLLSDNVFLCQTCSSDLYLSITRHIWNHIICTHYVYCRPTYLCVNFTSMWQMDTCYHGNLTSLEMNKVMKKNITPDEVKLHVHYKKIG